MANKKIKKFSAGLVAVSILGTGGTAFASDEVVADTSSNDNAAVATSDSVDIVDGKLIKGINRELNRDEFTEVTKSDLEKLNKLTLNTVEDLNGLRYAKNLKDLSLRDTNISNFSEVKYLNNLEKLFLGTDSVDNLEPISNLSNLKELHINGTLRNSKIKTLKPLTNLKGLKKLVLDEVNGVDNKEVIGGLTGLEDLTIASAGLTDINFLKPLVNLKKLTLSDNKISDISVIENFTNLENLEIDLNEEFTDYSPLSKLNNLKRYSEGILGNVGDVDYYVENPSEFELPKLIGVNGEKIPFENLSTLIKEGVLKKLPNGKYEWLTPGKLNTLKTLTYENDKFDIRTSRDFVLRLKEVDQPKVDQPKVDQPKVDQPKVDQPKDDVEFNVVPKDYPVVDLPIAKLDQSKPDVEFNVVPKDYPVVDLPMAKIEGTTEQPNGGSQDFVVAGGYVNLSSELPSENKGKVESPKVEDEKVESKASQDKKEVKEVPTFSKKSGKTLPNTGVATTSSLFAGLLTLIGAMFLARKKQK